MSDIMASASSTVHAAHDGMSLHCSYDPYRVFVLADDDFIPAHSRKEAPAAVSDDLPPTHSAVPFLIAAWTILLVSAISLSVKLMVSLAVLFSSVVRYAEEM